MSSFTAPLDFASTDLPFLGGRRIVKTTRTFAYWTDLPGERLTITVPAGFLTDLGSVPRPFWSIIAPDGPHSQAFALHDFLYRNPHLASRAMADAIFYEALRMLGVSRWRAWTMWAAVRVGGRHAYGRSFY